MQPVRTDQATGIYGAPPGMEDVVEGLPYWREKDPDTGGTIVRSVWTLSADEREAVALGGNVLLGILGEPIPPVQLAVLSPIDVPAYGMAPLDPEYAVASPVEDHHDAGLLRWILLGYALIAALLVGVGFLAGRMTS